MKGDRVNRGKPIRILHVDDEENQLEFTKLFLEEIDKDVVIDSTSDPDEAIQLASKNSYDCIVSDYKMLTMSGVELAQKVRENSKVPFILYTGQGSEEVAQSAFEAGVDDYLKKESEPSHYQVLARRVRQNVEKYRAEQLYRKEVNESRDGIIIVTGTTIAFANRAADRMIGGGEPGALAGKNLLDYVIGNEKEVLDRLCHEGEGEEAPLLEMQLRTGKGSIRVAEVSSTLISYLGQESHLCFFRDVTHRKRAEERVEALHQQAMRLGSLTDLHSITAAALDIMEDAFEYQVISFHVVEGDRLNTLDIRGAPRLSLSLPMDGPGITVKSAREKHSILVNDVRGCKDFFRGSVDSLSELAVPVVVEGETAAVLNVESLEPNDFTEDDRKLLETLSYHVAYAVSRVTGRKLGSEEEKAVRLDYALGRLDDAEKVDTLVQGDLKGSLRSIRNASGILRDRPEMLPDLVTSIDRDAEHASKVADMIRDTVAAPTRDGSFTEVNAVVKSVLELAYVPRNVHVRSALSEAKLIAEVPVEKMTRLLDNLVRNAVESMETGGTLEVKVTARQGSARIEVKDTGPGIPPHAMDRLFQPFNTTKKSHSGLGLAYAKETLEAFGGLIEAKTGEKGTTMVVTIPTRKIEKD